MRRNITFLCGMFLAAYLSSCAPQAGVGIVGTYVEAKNKRVVSFEGEEYTFMEDGRFRYKLQNDDLSSSKVGFGEFSIYNDVITFQFKPQEDFEQSEVIERQLEKESADTFQYEFEVKDVTGKPLLGANVVLLGLDIPFLGVVTNNEGSASIQAPKYHKIHGFRVSMLGFEQIEHQMVKGNYKYEVILVEKFGQRIVLSKVEKTFQRKGRKIVLDEKTFVPKKDD